MPVAGDQMKGIEYERGRKRKLSVRSRSPSTDTDSRNVRAKQDTISAAKDVSSIKQREEQEDVMADGPMDLDAATYLRKLLLELPETHPQYGEIREVAQFLACFANSQDIVMTE